MSYFNVSKGLYNNQAKEVAVNSSGSIIVALPEIVSVLNNSTTPLLAGTAFTGSTEHNPLPDVMVSCKTDQSGTLLFDFSNDGTNWDTFPSAGFTITANIHEFHTAVKGARYFRVRLVNSSGSNQTYLRLYTYYGTYRQGNLPLNQSIAADADAVITRGVLVGATDGGQYINVPVTAEGHLEVAIHDPTLPFGALHAERLVPIFQTDSVYGLNSGQVLIGSSSSGTVIASESMFVCSTGDSIYSQAFLQSRNRLRYRPGQGVVARFTAIFSPPVDNSYQVIGVGHAEDGIYIGYSGSAFGLLHSSFGTRQQQLLTLASGSSTAENITVVLNSVSSSIAVTNSANAFRTAYEISQGSYNGWKAECTGSNVLFIADSVGAKNGQFSLVASTAIGTFSSILSGSATTEVFISQSQWSIDPLNGSGPSGATLNPQLGNVYEIGIQYLGFGNITLRGELVSGDNNANFSRLHTYAFPNTRTKPTFANPAFPFLMSAASAGSTSNVSVKCASFAGFIEGEKKLIGNRYSHQGTVTSVSTTLYTTLFTIYNSRRFSGRANQSVINLLSFAYGARLANNAYGELVIVKNGILTGSPNFTRVDDWSATNIDTAATSVTFGEDGILLSIPLIETQSDVYPFLEELLLQPGEWLSVACKLNAGTATFVDASLNTREDQ